MPNHENQPRRFPSTHWSLVDLATQNDPVTKQKALAMLLQRYLPALRAFAITKHRLSWHNANDIVQGFITNKILEHDLFGKVDPARGKLRTLLMTSLDRYFISTIRAQRAIKRSTHRSVSLHTEGIYELAQSNHKPDRTFDTAWARHLIAQAIRTTKAHCLDTDRRSTWGVFYHRIIRTTLLQKDPLPYETIVSRYRFDSPTQASNAMITAKRMFARNLRAIIAEYAITKTDQENELIDLIKALSPPPK